MASSITFPAVPLVPAVSTSRFARERMHRLTSVAERGARRSAVGRHPSAQAVSPAVAQDTVRSISCLDCTQRNTATCQDCVVTFLCGSDIDLRLEEALALSSLQSAGLVPPSRHSIAG